MAAAEPQVMTTVCNHWWWRPGWRVGRHYYACHLTLDDQPELRAAYVNSDGPAQPIADALSNTNPQPVTVTFGTASVLVSHRDHRMYEWTQATPIPIGPGQDE